MTNVLAGEANDKPFALGHWQVPVPGGGVQVPGPAGGSVRKAALAGMGVGGLLAQAAMLTARVSAAMVITRN